MFKKLFVATALVFGVHSHASAESFDVLLEKANADGCINVEEGRELEASQGNTDYRQLTNKEIETINSFVPVPEGDVIVYGSRTESDLRVIVFDKADGCFIGMGAVPLFLFETEASNG